MTSGMIGGYAFLDANDDGYRDPDSEYEPSVPYVPVRLFACAASPPPADGAETGADDIADESVLLAATRTNAQGLYSFRNLFSGYYRVEVRPTSDYTTSTFWSGGGSGGNGTSTANTVDGDLDNDFDPVTRSTTCFQLIGGDTDISWNIGMVPLNDDGNDTATTDVSDIVATSAPATTAPASASVTTSSPVINSAVKISGIVFHDFNSNGYFDTVDIDETGLSNVQVALFDCDGSIKLATRTDDNGMYGFPDLVAGSYLVRFSPPEGYQISSIWTGLVDDADNNADPATNGTICQEYQAGYTESMLDVGMSSVSEGSTSSSMPAGDGAPCSGAKCPIDGMCRNKSGLCGDGINFCNSNSVWNPMCTEGMGENGVNAPSTTPPVSLLSLSSPPVAAADDDVPSICNDDGSVGITMNDAASNNEKVRGVNVAFTYAIKSGNGAAPDSSLVAKFENELNTRLACAYFDDNCLSCEDDSDNIAGRVRRRRTSSRIRFMFNVNNSSVAGISALPKDEPNTVKGKA